MTARKWLFGLLLLFAAWLAPYNVEQARATTMVAQVCTVFSNPCPLFNTVDSGIRSNGVGTLGFNRFALLPFVFNDVNVNLSGNVLVADLLVGGSNFIYMYATGIGTNILGNGFFLNSIIGQNYRTLGGLGTFGAFDIATCNAAATLAGDASAMQPFVNGNALLGGGFVACPAIVQAYGPNGVLTGAVTNMTAAEIMQFNPSLPFAAITLPWGDDLPDSADTQLSSDIAASDPVSTILSDLEALDPSLTQQVPEPASLMVLSAGLLGLGAMRRKWRA